MEFGALFNTNPIFRLLTNCEMKNEFQMRQSIFIWELKLPTENH